MKTKNLFLATLIVCIQFLNAQTEENPISLSLNLGKNEYNGEYGNGIFDFKKPGLRLSENPGYNPGGVSVGFDLDEIINMFRFKRNKSLASLQQRLLQQEEDKYIDHRFSMAFVRKITKLTSPELEDFMKEYRPDYEMVQRMNELELGYFIERNYAEYKAKKYNKGAPRKY